MNNANSVIRQQFSGSIVIYRTHRIISQPRSSLKFVEYFVFFSLSQQMLKSFIELNLNHPHDKSAYSIKKNKLVVLKQQPMKQDEVREEDVRMSKFSSKGKDDYDGRVFGGIRLKESNSGGLSTSGMLKRQQSSTFSNTSSKTTSKNNNSRWSLSSQQQINFDCITFDFSTTNQKLLFQLLMLKPCHPFQQSSPPQPPTTLTMVFNYDIQYQKLEQLIQQLLAIKQFSSSSFRIAHFELRNNHISDYNKVVGSKKKADQMDSFTKEIDTCIKLDKTYKIKENVTFKSFNAIDWKTKDVLNKTARTNYDKKTNQFFVLDIDQGKWALNVIVLHRQKDYVLTKVQEKQIEEAFILLKNTEGQHNNDSKKINIQFTTSLVQIMQSYLIASHQVILVSSYPTSKSSSSLSQTLSLPQKISVPCPSALKEIIQRYTRQNQTKLQLQMQKMRTRLRELHYKKKATQENIAYLMKKYKKGFEGIMDSLNYLRKNNITDLNAYRGNLENQIKQKDEQILQMMQYLKTVNQQIILAGQRNQYFKTKMQLLKQNLQDQLQNMDVGMNSSQCKSPASDNVTSCNQPSTPELTQAILNKFLEAESQNPYSIQLQREVDKYSNQLRQKTRERVLKCRQLEQFHQLMDQLRKKLSKVEFTKLEQKYLGLIGMC